MIQKAAAKERKRGRCKKGLDKNGIKVLQLSLFSL